MRMTAPWVLAGLMLASGCGKEGDNQAKNAGQETGKAVTDFAAGFGRGVDKSLLVNLTLAPALEQAGLSQTTAKWTLLEEGKKGISVYLLSKTAWKGTLIAKGFNKEGLEIGRAVTDVDFGADDAQYIAFKFNAEMDTQWVDKCTVDIRK